ncbi:MAG: hypothetical protein QNJ97_12185 [Myxococcota bacterium]|nr:hypothetical protein [Myxococcota bacterium]
MTTETFHLPVPNKLTDDVAHEIAKRVVYCDQRIVGSRHDAQQGQLAVTIEAPGHSASIADKVRSLIAQMSAARLAGTSRTLKERSGDIRSDAKVIERLGASGEIEPQSLGLVARGGSFLNLIERLDGLVQRIACEMFGAQVRDYNSLIPADWLRRAGYFSNFAHSVTFAVHLKEDLDQLNQFVERHGGNAELHLDSIDELAQPAHCLSPAVCYHAYGGLMDSQFNKADGGLKVFTARGRCFRYESKNTTNLDRLMEFSMREIIFVGEKEQVLLARERACEVWWRLIELLQLGASLETAADPFFASDFSSLRFFQLTNELKWELLLPVSQDKSIAAASFNYHESFFGQNFAIRQVDAEPVHTGCAAFGLERLAYALLMQIPGETLFERLDWAQQKLFEQYQ